MKFNIIKNLKDKLKALFTSNNKLLQTNKYLLEDIIYNMPGYIYWKSSDSQYMGCNKNLADISQLKSAKDIVGKFDSDFLWGQKQAEDFKAEDRRIVSSGRTLISEDKIPIDNARHIVVRTEKKPLFNRRGEVTAILGVAVDITAEKQAEQFRLEKIKAEQAQKDAEISADRMKELAFTIAHEMRTPLSSISGMIYSAENYIKDLVSTQELAEKNNFAVTKLSRADKEFLLHLSETIQNETKKTFLTINLLLGNVQQGNFNPAEFVMCNLAETIEQALKRYPMTDRQKSKLNIDVQNNFFFQGDQELFIHVLFNLLKNALYYTASKGEIYLKTEITTTHNILHFKDTGTGIAAEALLHIFEQFFSKTLHGTGLGLAFCKRVMTAFGGDISCKSVQNEYTEFVMRFPKVDPV